MVVGGSTDWLPSGWTVQSNVLRSGRETRYFKNVQTGKTCFSKDDVMQCINMQNTHRPTNAPIRRRSVKNNTRLIVKQSEYPDWLPNGWIMETKTRRSGSRIGSKYKIYIDPLFGCKFYSKPEVFNYLKSLKQKRCIAEQPKTDIKCPVVVEDCREENLPPGWKKEIRVRKCGNRIKRDPFYTDPVNGYVFQSRKEVLRYLEKGEISKYALKWKRQQIRDQELMNDKSSVLVEDCREENLPPGWKKEIRIRKCGKRDPFYTDPVNGYVFRSRREVSRYLEKGEISKYALTWKKRQIRDQELMNDKSSSKVNDPSTSENNSAGNGSFDSANSVTPKASESKRRQSKRLRLSNDILEETMVEDVIKESKKQKELNLPRRSSSRLAGTEPKLAVHTMFRGSSVVNASRDSYKREVTMALSAAPVSKQNNLKLGKKLADPTCANIDTPVSAVLRDTGLVEKSSRARTKLDSSKPMKLVPRRCIRFNNAASSSGDADRGLAPHPGFNGANQQIKVVPSTGPSSSSKKAHEDLIVTLGPLQNPESENIDAEKTGPCSFPDLWSDPCLEFAFKTLTGAIPLDTAIQGCFQQQCDRPRPSGPALPDIGSPGSFRNDISYLFDGPEKTSTQKQAQLQLQGSTSLLACSGVGTEVKKDIPRKVRS